ncbi:NYN domain-containing protein [Salinibacter altiplanensis]|uniref:NYN domain-containing protein n=1 Tax=Salinibacter altiplanensis TaxID=1803181 RepID=UPI000C9F427E|nr:NYN domain-containing protein [Salinibacter altiplanensis]
MSYDSPADGEPPRRAAMYVDYDNLYTILRSQSERDRSTSAYAEEIFEEVRRYLEEGDDTPTIQGRAYGTFDTLPDGNDTQIPSALHRKGITPVHVSAGMQDNTSEIRLTLDVTQALTRRPNVQTVVIVTGNRPYLPLVRWIREQGCRPLVAAVNPPQTADTPSFVEDSRYLDARNLLSEESREDLLANAPTGGATYTRAQAPDAPPPQQFQSLDNPAAQRAIKITEKHFGQYDEVYLTPLLRKLSDIMGPDEDPKSLVSELEAAGAARLEKRNGYPYNYTVLIVNDEHPSVQELHETVGHSSTSSPSPSSGGDGDKSADAYDMDEAIQSPTAPASAVTSENEDEASSRTDED